MEKIDMSLDDIIKINKKEQKKQKAKVGVKTQTKVKQFRTSLGNRKQQNKNFGNSPLKRQNKVQQNGRIQNKQQNRLVGNKRTQQKNQRQGQQRVTRQNQQTNLQRKGLISRSQRQRQQNLSYTQAQNKVRRQQQNIQTRQANNQRLQQNIQTRQANKQRLQQKTARANIVNKNRGIQTPLYTRKAVSGQKQLNRNFSGTRVQVEQLQPQQQQQNRQRQRRWGRTSQVQPSDGIITINVKNDFVNKRQNVNQTQKLQINRQQTSLQEEIRNLKPTKKQNFNFQRNDFNKGQTNLSLNDRFSVNRGPGMQTAEGLRQVYL